MHGRVCARVMARDLSCPSRLLAAVPSQLDRSFVFRNYTSYLLYARPGSGGSCQDQLQDHGSCQNLNRVIELQLVQVAKAGGAPVARIQTERGRLEVQVMLDYLFRFWSVWRLPGVTHSHRPCQMPHAMCPPCPQACIQACCAVLRPSMLCYTASKRKHAVLCRCRSSVWRFLSC